MTAAVGGNRHGTVSHSRARNRFRFRSNTIHEAWRELASGVRLGATIESVEGGIQLRQWQLRRGPGMLRTAHARSCWPSVHTRRRPGRRSERSGRLRLYGRSVLVMLCVVTVTAALSIRPTMAAEGGSPETVSFPSLDGSTQLTGYLFKPEGRHADRAPAIVLLHGRAGPYSSLAHGRYDASTLSKRHMMWGHFWAARGYVALLPDSFGPRGFPKGFAAGTHAERPSDVNEVTVRPLDAYGGLKYLRQRGDVDPERIGLQGWSNGGSAALATMADDTVRSAGLTPRTGFRGALAFYPGCGLQNKFKTYNPSAPVRIFIGTADEEVSPPKCQALAEGSRGAGNDIAITVYPEATHDFDDPGTRRQSVSANVFAARDAMEKAAQFMRERLSP